MFTYAEVGEIKNVGLENVSIKGQYNVGDLDEHSKPITSDCVAIDIEAITLPYLSTIS